MAYDWQSPNNCGIKQSDKLAAAEGRHERPGAAYKLIEIRTLDDPTPNSILFDWESIVGASYEIKWFSNAPMTQLVGSATSTASEYVISGLTPGQQYWMIVRPVRGSETGPWSDPATRVANV